MKFLYLDAARDPGFPAPYGKSQTKRYILTGLSIDPVKDWAMGSEKLTEIVRRYFPNKEDSPKELSYTDLIAKKKPFDSLSGEQRKELAEPQVYACNQSSYVDYKSAHNILQIQTREFDKIYSLT